MVRVVLRAAKAALERATKQAGGYRAASSTGSRVLGAAATERLQTRQHKSRNAALTVAGVAAATLAVVAASSDGGTETLAEAKKLVSGGILAQTAGEDDEATPRLGRRHMLKSRSRHAAKLKEEDQMKIRLDAYKQRRASIDSLRTRFETYASQSVPAKTGDKRVKAMTFTDFLHSFVLPQFRLKSPRSDVEYTCDFVGDANGLITYEECYLLIHLLQIPKEHFDVAFCMFDLDGDGSVDKQEFCAVVENLLRTITSSDESKEEVVVSAEETLPRLTEFLFGRFSKTITATDLETALDTLRKHILRAEFDLYAVPHPTLKGQQAISVHDFALTLVSCFEPDKLPPYLERVQALNASEALVTWDEFVSFHFNVQSNLADIKLAFDLTGAEEITEAEFIRAAHVVSGVELSSPVVELAFRIFDDNDNGTLDQSELFKVLEMRNTVQLKQEPPSASQFQKFWRCVKDHNEH